MGSNYRSLAVRKLLQDGGVKDAEIIPEDGVQALRSADDWWTIALGTGLRWTIDQMGPEAAARVKARQCRLAARKQN